MNTLKPIAQIFVEQLEAYRAKPAPAGPRKRLLVVDDNPDYTQLLKEIFTDDFDVVCVHEPREAVTRAAESVPFAGVLLDLNFQGAETGIHALEKIRQLLPTVPVAIISNFLDKDGRLDSLARELGIRVLSKNERCETLKATVAAMT